MIRMKRYFDDLDSLNRFTLSLDCQADSLRCQHCSKKDQFVSHGFVYKKQFHGKTRPVGRRLFCSNRYGRSGCGRTVRLYLKTELAKWHYTATHLTVFLLTLLAGQSTQQAYQVATQTTEPRNAWRWLNALRRKLIDYRVFVIPQTSQPVGLFKSMTKQRRIVLSTLQTFFSTFGESACSLYQSQTQCAFV
jgi:hypothetical protein